MRKIISCILVLAIVAAFTVGCSKQKSHEENFTDNCRLDYFVHRKHTATIVENDEAVYWARTDSIYRQDKTGNTAKRIYEGSHPDNLLLSGDALFFLDASGKMLFSVQTDGEDARTVLDITEYDNSMYISDYQIENDSVYFLWQNTLYSYSINEKQFESLENINIDRFQIVGEFMYYIDHAPRTFTVYQMNLNTGETSILAGYGQESPRDNVCKDFLRDKDRLLCVQTHPNRFYLWENHNSVTLSTGRVTNFYIAQGILYYVDFDDESSTLYAYDFEQNERTAVAILKQFDKSRGFSVIDGAVYYYSGYSVQEEDGNKIYDYDNSALLCQKLSVSACENPTDQLPEETNSSGDAYQYEVENDTVKILSYLYDPDEMSIIVPEKIEGKLVTVLGQDAFYQHKNTISITLPYGLTTIEGSPFYRCYSLQDIVIPAGVKEITGNPFFRSSSLTSITVASDNAYYSDLDGVLFDKERTVLLSYPEGRTEEEYVIPETVQKISGDAFGYHTQLKRITILSNVTEFPDWNMFIFPDDITLLVESDSVAERYAKEYGLNFQII